ncbi:MAG TPA: NUDIX hydrolase N-terminal domain-containing protein [Prolixibacteraceae bacterium]|nr:NUDIX hydrolase N-terminal domain-containing protein [Prolixibacteraceae bacterium]
MSNFYFEKIKRIQALSEIGLEFYNNEWDAERFQEIREIAMHMLEKMTDVPIEKIIPVIE